MGYARALDMPPIDYGGLVHNMYFLNLAEVGVLGLILYCVMAISPVVIGWRNSFRDRHGIRGDILLGLAVGQTATVIHTWLEWALRQTEVGYVQWMIFGLIAGVSHQVKKRQKEEKQRGRDDRDGRNDRDRSRRR
jgi:O-antigen ligase